MAPPKKRLRKADYAAESSEEESEDEWEQDRQARASGSGVGQASGRRGRVEEEEEYGTDESEEEEEEGVAQFESDEGEFVESDDHETAVHKQIAAVPFGTLLQAKKKLAKSSAKRGGDSDSDDDDEDEGPAGSRGEARKRQNKKDIKKRAAERASKHAPMEMSSKRAVGRTRTIVETTASKARDPRFDSLSGSFNPALFKNSYDFLNDAAQKELQTMRETAKKARKSQILPEEDKEEIEAALRRMESKELARKNKEREGRAMKEWKKEEERKRGEGKKEFFLKKADRKQVVLKAKFDELATDKKTLRKAIERKRKKTSSKEKKLLPNRR